MSENTGRSYRRRSSRYPDSLPARASATTSWSLSDGRSFAVGMRRVIYAVNAAVPPTPAVNTASPGASASPAEKRRYVREMFSAIAPTYDLLNHALSLNVDRGWRLRALRRLGWEARPGGR